MKKIKIIYAIILVLIVILLIFKIQPFKVESNFKTEYKYKLLITKVLGNKLSILSKGKTIQYNEEELLIPQSGTIKSDIQTTYQIVYSDYMITASANSILTYNLRTRELNFKKGVFDWKKHSNLKNFNIYVTSDKVNLTLSQYGKIAISDDFVEIWNYKGMAELFVNNNSTKIISKNYLKFQLNDELIADNTKALLDSPAEIFPGFPIKKTLVLKKPADSVLTFNWKAVRTADNYIMKIYSDNLRDNILFSEKINANTYVKNMIEFIDINKFFWEIIPFDEQNQLEGIPSEMGEIEILGNVLNVSDTKQKPVIEISSLTVIRNRVEIKGISCNNCQIFINNENIMSDEDGYFSHTIRFNRSGEFDIKFKVISPYQIESNFVRTVTIK